MPDWDANSAQLLKNLTALQDQLINSAVSRETPTLDMAKAWHTEIMDGLAVPDPNFVGRFRGEPGLERVHVRVGELPGVHPGDVASDLNQFMSRFEMVLQSLDDLIPIDVDLTADQLNAVLDLCGWVHAEWVRIHPFANGNGRSARLWANFVAMRYGLPPFVRLSPRPTNGEYALAGAAAMAGDWKPSADMMRILLSDFWQDT